jgi:hypothetical protein
LKKPVGSVRFYKQKTEKTKLNRTETDKKPEKNRAKPEKPSQNRAKPSQNRKKPSQNRENRAKTGKT